MTALTEYINKRENLLPLSLWVTLGVLLLIFLLLQILFFRKLQEEETLFREKMEVKELVKLRFDTQTDRSPRSPIKAATQKKAAPRRTANHEKPAPRNISPDVTNLLKSLSQPKTAAARSQVRQVNSEPAMARAGIATNVQSPLKAISENDFRASISSRPSTRPSGRRAASGVAGGSGVQAGAVSSGMGSVSSVNGSGITGHTGSRATRAAGNGGTGAGISLPVVDAGGGDATLDLNALIEWMKKHPGPIPKLVAHEMGHGASDLSSAIRFNMAGKSYTIFLSCNEHEMLLRVCLVENDDFILLKDAGIKEETHFLTMGDVLRRGSEIQSLISSRRAPGDTAAKFYSIFWAWWETVEK